MVAGERQRQREGGGGPYLKTQKINTPLYRWLQLSLGSFLRLLGVVLHYKYTEAEAVFQEKAPYLGGGVFIYLPGD